MTAAPAWSHEEIDGALANWRQGDCVLQSYGFLWRIDPERPLTDHAKAAAQGGSDAAGRLFPGAVVLTQTCDLVRKCIDRPMVEIAPLVQLEATQVPSVRKGREPRFLYIPALADQGLVGDLDVRMTVEKSVVARWARAPGWSIDDEGRKLTRAIVRKTGRFAFPNDIVDMLRGFESRIKEKHGKKSDEGKLLNALEEIRLIASPNWDHHAMDLEFLVVIPESISDEDPILVSQLKQWRGLIAPTARVTSIEFSLEKFSIMSAQRYLESDPMDFDHLSVSSAKA